MDPHELTKHKHTRAIQKHLSTFFDWKAMPKQQIDVNNEIIYNWTRVKGCAHIECANAFSSYRLWWCGRGYECALTRSLESTVQNESFFRMVLYVAGLRTFRSVLPLVKWPRNYTKTFNAHTMNIYDNRKRVKEKKN